MAALGTPWALRLLRHPREQFLHLPLSAGGDKGMAAGPAAAKPTVEVHVGPVQCDARGLHATGCSHPRLASTDGMIKAPIRRAGCVMWRRIICGVDARSHCRTMSCGS